VNTEEFERILDVVVEQLGQEVRASKAHHAPDAFQRRVLEVLKEVAKTEKLEVDPSFHPHAFPDIRANGFGIEVKTTNKDNWQSVGNSVFEGMRDPSVKEIYVVFGKMGGMPGVRWGRYEERITHVRISHAPRFVLEMDRDSSLFGKMDVGYDAFAALPPAEKMAHIRKYARGRLEPGEKLWWLEDDPEEQDKPLAVRVYMKLLDQEKRQIRAEAALLCPEICKPTQRHKYDNVALYILTNHNVICPQTRDLFSAGSVALRKDPTRGGNYVLRALMGIQDEMREAAERLPDDLFQEYWGYSYPAEGRIAHWLTLADGYAAQWEQKPSAVLFKD